MYRTEMLYKYIDLLVKDEDVYPVCIPSYSRPDARFLSNWENIPIHLFIRREEQELYKQYEGKCKIILLDNVSDVGETRRQIVNWAIESNKENIFMLDDDITRLYFNVPGVSPSTGKQFMRSYFNEKGIPEPIDIKFFKMWVWMIGLCSDKLTISGAGQRSDWWNMRYKDEPIIYNRGTPIQCIHLNISNLKKYNLNYNSTKIDGAEDYALIYKVMKSGLYTTLFTDLVYCIPSVGSGTGGCNTSEDKDLIERYRKFIDLFMTNVLHPEDAYRVGIKTSKGGLQSIKFNWNKWKITEKRPWGI